MINVLMGFYRFIIYRVCDVCVTKLGTNNLFIRLLLSRHQRTFCVYKSITYSSLYPDLRFPFNQTSSNKLMKYT